MMHTMEVPLLSELVPSCCCFPCNALHVIQLGAEGLCHAIQLVITQIDVWHGTHVLLVKLASLSQLVPLRLETFQSSCHVHFQEEIPHEVVYHLPIVCQTEFAAFPSVVSSMAQACNKWQRGRKGLIQ